MTQVELEMLRAMRAQGVTFEVCSIRMGRSIHTLHEWSRIHGISKGNLAPFWTSEKVEQARELIAGGLSASQAAREIGCSRNAVLGKLHRLGIMPKVEGRRSEPRKRKARVRSSKPDSGHVPPKVVIELPEEPTAETWTRLVDTTEDQCRWPVTEPDHNMMCCGAKKAHDATSYCWHHYRMSISLSQPRSRDERTPAHD